MIGDQLRPMVLALPGVEERETWGHPPFRVGVRIVVGLAEDAKTATIRASKPELAAPIAADAETFKPARYAGRYGWVAVRLDRVNEAQMGELVIEAWRAVAPKRVVEAHRNGSPTAGPAGTLPGTERP